MKVRIAKASDTIKDSEADKIEAKKQRAILENMKQMLMDLREKFHTAAEAARKSISDKMLLLKKRFNQIYKQLHGEEYYSVAGSNPVSLSSRLERARVIVDKGLVKHK